MSAAEFTIGFLARAGGVKVQTIRYYEQVSLLPEPRRSPGNQRLYTKAHMDRLKFIRHSRALGFSLDQIRELLALSENPKRPCDEIDAVARRHLEDVEGKIARLEGLKGELGRMISECAGGKVSACRIIKVLSDHDLCIVDDHGTGGLG
jgi:DNA-binding transcriptional MerR regulator